MLILVIFLSFKIKLFLKQHFPFAADAGQSKRASDIISMLVSVYGSKELFVNEYRILLADRLLSQFNYNTDKEIRYLELLKRRYFCTLKNAIYNYNEFLIL